MVISNLGGEIFILNGRPASSTHVTCLQHDSNWETLVCF